MKRFWLVPLLALASLAGSPSPAPAHFFFRGWCSPYGGGYGWGVPYYQPYFVPQYYLVPLPPPVIVPQNFNPGIPPAKSPGTPRSDAVPRQAPMVTVVPGMPEPAPKNPEPDPKVKPAAGGFAPPMSAPEPLTIPDPKVPAKPTTDVPPLVLPGASDAKPMPAPAPSGDPLPLIPLPEPRKAPIKAPDGKSDLPPLVLPPEGSGNSSGVIPSISRSSPLTGAVKVQVFAASGGAVTGTLRKVGFFNHTDRDLDLVIEGKSVKLPKKSYLHAELPVKFSWKAAGNDANSTIVPDGAAGVDVLFTGGQ